MKFFVFTCLLAVALAKHKMEQSSSSEESTNISQAMFKQQKEMVILPTQETICSEACDETTKNIPRMVVAEVSTNIKDSQSDEKMNLFQYLQASAQRQMAMNPWGQMTQPVYPTIYTMESARFPQEQYKQMMNMGMHATQETPKKTIDMESMEVLTEKTMMTEEEKNFLNYLNKMNQYKKITWPQYQKVLQQYQNMMDPRATYQHMPTVRYF